ncbi:unnamed protein product [Caenorhabditis nigoni]
MDIALEKMPEEEKCITDRRTNIWRWRNRDSSPLDGDLRTCRSVTPSTPSSKRQAYGRIKVECPEVEGAEPGAVEHQPWHEPNI